MTVGAAADNGPGDNELKHNKWRRASHRSRFLAISLSKSVFKTLAHLINISSMKPCLMSPIPKYSISQKNWRVLHIIAL